MNAKTSGGKAVPDWHSLCTTLAQIANISADQDELSIASQFERKYGRVQLIETIRDALHADHPSPGEAHEAFAKLAFDTVYTTNFDMLLEDSYSDISKPYQSLVGELQIPFHGGPHTTSIVKMHGDVRHQEHMIITKSDYDTYLDNYPVIATHLSAMLIVKTGLFIGYSLRDPDFNNIWQVVKSRLGNFIRMAYVVQFNAAPSDIESKLDDKIHIISIDCSKDESKDVKLANLFDSIRYSLDVKEGIKLRESRPDIFESISKEEIEKISKDEAASTLWASISNLCYVTMPFTPVSEDIYDNLIKPVMSKFGLHPLRANNMPPNTGSMSDNIRVAIQQSRLCIADISSINPNIMYEIGMAQSLNKPMVFLSNSAGSPPFSLRSYKVILYKPDSLDSSRKALEISIRNVFGKGILEEAESLIQKKMYRASIATLGMLLEQSLRQYEMMNQVVIEDKKRSPSMLMLLDDLRSRDLISVEDTRLIRECISIRNKSVHELMEPDEDQAKQMFRCVNQFIDKYLGQSFLN